MRKHPALSNERLRNDEMDLIADVTRAYKDTVVKTLEKAKPLLGPGDKMTVLLHDDQQAEIQMSGMDTSSLILKPVSRNTSLQHKALELALEAIGTSPMTVFLSFWPHVLAVSEQIDAASKPKIHFCPWGRLYTLTNMMVSERATAAMPTTATVAPVSDSEAVALLVEVLKQKGADSPAKAIKKTALRPLMSERDARFFKANPATGNAYYIGSLLTRARAAGLIEVEARANNADIWLGRPSQMNLMGVSRAAAPTPAAMNDAPKPRLSSEEHYDQILRSNTMGPFANVRDELYAALEEILSRKLTLDKLLTECITTAKSKLQGERDKGIPWGKVRAFFVALLTRCPVLRDSDGKPVTPCFQSMRAVIESVDADFKEKLDGELVLFILENGAEIRYVDMPALVATLYMTREEKFENRLTDVLARLHGSGKIQYVGDAIQLPKPETGNVTTLSRTA